MIDDDLHAFPQERAAAPPAGTMHPMNADAPEAAPRPSAMGPVSAASAAPAPTAVLADDERLMREQLRARLVEVWPELRILAEARNGLEAVQLVDEHRPDLSLIHISVLATMSSQPR